MSWFNVDDKAHSDACFHRVGLDGFGLFAAAGSYCMDYLTDGFVPNWFIDGWSGGPEAAKKLVSEGMWACVPGGFQYVKWKEALTRAYVEARKAKWRNNKKRLRAVDSSPPQSPPRTSAKAQAAEDVHGGVQGGRLVLDQYQDQDQPQLRKGHLEEGILGGGDFSGSPVDADAKRSPPAAGSPDKNREIELADEPKCILCRNEPRIPGKAVGTKCLPVTQPQGEPEQHRESGS